jgi:maltooligosyltrehalose trehalohydrolase
VTYKPLFGAWPLDKGVLFTVWAPTAQHVEILLEDNKNASMRMPLRRDDRGGYSLTIPDCGSGTRYRYFLDGEGPFPDPASRFQPEGVHGPSQVVCPEHFSWTDSSWQGIALEQAVFYELHVGTFTPGGTFKDAIERLPYLSQLGITVVELMPVAEFAGDHNWGYDGVSLFAPSHRYGSPDDLRQFVDKAHGLGLAVVLDVVYNHLGPDGSYLGRYSPYYLSTKHKSPWGASLNFDGENSALVRRFFLENAMHWICEYHLDGLRLDATHAIVDDSPVPIVAEIAAAARRVVAPKSILVIAEDDRNDVSLLQPAEQGGWGMDAVWADDLHHQLRAGMAGDRQGYFCDFSGSLEDVAETIRKGWFYCGQHSVYRGHARGTDSAGQEPRRFVVCLQNHDQVGNRGFGDRLHHAIAPELYRALSTLLLLCPQTPLLFMGQEWAASSPFMFFTDHGDPLGKQVTEGRRREFKDFREFSDEGGALIPDPQSRITFEKSRLVWTEQSQEGHAGVLGLYRMLLAFRRQRLQVSADRPQPSDCLALDDSTLTIRRFGKQNEQYWLIAHLKGSGEVDLSSLDSLKPFLKNTWRVVWTTEDAAYTSEGKLPVMRQGENGPLVIFSRPSAVLLQCQDA